MVNLLISEEVDQKIQLSENDLQAYYTQNNALFQEGSQRRASHILVETEGEAKAVLRSLRAGADFAKLAQSRSQDPGSKDRGGDLGFFTRGQLVPEFEKAVFSMKKGEISNPVKTQFGYHVIKLVDLSPAVAYEEARAQIQQLLYNQQKQALTQQLLSDLRESTKIEKNLPQETSETAQAPAVQ